MKKLIFPMMAALSLLGGSMPADSVMLSGLNRAFVNSVGAPQLFIFDTATGKYTVIHKFAEENPGDYNIYFMQAKDKNLYGVTYPTGISNDMGKIFKLTVAGEYSVLHEMDSSEGSYLMGNLIQAKDGDLYGMSNMNGGSSDGRGSIYKITPQGELTVVHVFNGTDGGSPKGSLFQASDGNFYGMGGSGGKEQIGTFFRCSPSGQFKMLHEFTNGLEGTPTDGAYPSGNSLAQASDGTLYGMTDGGGKFGGPHGFGIIFTYTSDGKYTLIHNFGGDQAPLGDEHSSLAAYPRGTLTLGPDGNFYGLSYNGGSSNMGTIFRCSKDGKVKILHHFKGSAVDGDGMYPDGSLTLGSDGNFYGLTHGGGSGSAGIIFKITPTGQYSKLYAFTGTFDGTSFPGEGLIEVKK